MFSLDKAGICKKSTVSNDRAFFVVRHILLLLPLCLTGCTSLKAKLPMIFPPPVRVTTPAPPPVYHTPDGLKITPLNVPLDENSRILGIHKWRFAVTPPPLAKWLQYRLEWEEPGRPTKRLRDSASSLDSTDTQNILIALQPVGEPLSNSPQLRLFVGEDRGYGSSFVDNPMAHPPKGYSPGASFSQTFRKDGSWVLLEEGNRFPSPQNPKLVLRMKALKTENGFDTSDR